jgi:hypothetical protein
VSLLSPFSSLVMQTPIFLIKLSDESIIFISDVGKNLLTVVGSFLLYGSFQLSSSVLFRALLYSISKIPSISQNIVAISLPFLAVDPLHGFLFCRWIPVVHPRFITCYNFLKSSSSSDKVPKFSSQMCCRRSLYSGLSNFGIQRALKPYSFLNLHATFLKL